MPSIFGDNTIPMLQALMPTSSFQQKRADKAAELMYANDLVAMAEKRQGEVIAQQQELEKVTTALASLPVRSEDAIRLKEMIDSRSSEYLKGARESGDPEAWFKANLPIIGNKLTRDILGSNELGLMQENKVSMARLEDDKANGRYTMDMEVTLKDGSKKVLRAFDAENKFKNGEVIGIRYNNGFDLPDIRRAFEFFSTHDNPAWRERGNKVTYDDVYGAFNLDPAAKNIPEDMKQVIYKEIYDKYAKNWKWNNNDLAYKYANLNQQESQFRRRLAAEKQQAANKADNSRGLNLYDTSVLGNFFKMRQQQQSNPAEFAKRADSKGMVAYAPVEDSNADVARRLLTGSSTPKTDEDGFSPISKERGLYLYDQTTGRYRSAKNTDNSIRFRPSGKVGFNMNVNRFADYILGKDNYKPNAMFGGDIKIDAKTEAGAWEKVQDIFRGDGGLTVENLKSAGVFLTNLGDGAFSVGGVQMAHDIVVDDKTLDYRNARELAGNNANEVIGYKGENK